MLQIVVVVVIKMEALTDECLTKVAGKQQKYYRTCSCINNFSSVLLIRIRDPVPLWTLYPGWVKNEIRILDPGPFHSFFF